MRITRAADNGKLSRVNDKYRLGDLVDWARRQKEWRYKFDDLPASASPVLISGVGTLAALGAQRKQQASGTLTVIPESAADRAAMIVDKQRRNTMPLRARKNKALRDELEKCRAAEERRKNINAKKGKRTM